MFKKHNLHPPRVTGPNKKKMDMYFRHRNKIAIEEGTIDASVTDKGVAPIGLYPFKVHIRFSNRSSATPKALVLNNHEAIVNSAVKLKTKRIWKENEIPSPEFFKPLDYVDRSDNTFDADRFIAEVGFPVIAKLIQGQQSEGLYRIKNIDDLATFCSEVTISKYYFERLIDFDQEYRFHVSPHLKGQYVRYLFQKKGKITSFESRDGVILPQKKLLKREAYAAGIRINTRPAGFDNYILSTQFEEMPWMEEAFKTAVKAIEVLGMDFGAVDVGYNTRTGIYTFFESVSNPGMCNLTGICYQQAFPHIIMAKAKKEGLISGSVAKMNNEIKNSVKEIVSEPEVAVIPASKPSRFTVNIN